MATSILTASGRVQMFNDLDLIALLCVIERELESSVGRYGELREVVSMWQRALEAYGPGTIDLELDSLESHAGALEQLRVVLAATVQNLVAGPEILPAAILNERTRAPGVVFVDYKASRIVEAAYKMQELL